MDLFVKHTMSNTYVSAVSPICSDFQTFCPDWLHFGHSLCMEESPPRSSVSGYFLYISDMPDLIPRSIPRKSAAFRYFSWNCHLPLTRARGPDRPNIFT